MVLAASGVCFFQRVISFRGDHYFQGAKNIICTKLVSYFTKNKRQKYAKTVLKGQINQNLDIFFI